MLKSIPVNNHCLLVYLTKTKLPIGSFFFNEKVGCYLRGFAYL